VIEFRAFQDFDKLSTTLGDQIACALTKGVADKGGASVAVPGGTTPGAFFDVLCRRTAPWERVTVTLTDERWVDTQSDRSNEHLVRARLLTGAAAGAKFVGLKTEHATAHEAEAEIHARVAAIAKPFDVVILGMGDDGHTASWIPDSEGLAAALDQNDPALARAISPPSSTGLGERITLTRRAITNSKIIVVLIRGEEKRRAYDVASTGSDISAMPVRAILFQDRVPVSVFWSAR
jgi:6-phosphogluconolactonase